MDRPLRCDMCGQTNPLNKYTPTYSTHNACRCPECGSTKNIYNSAHGWLVSLAMQGGPVVTVENVWKKVDHDAKKNRESNTTKLSF